MVPGITGKASLERDSLWAGRGWSQLELTGSGIHSCQSPADIPGIRATRGRTCKPFRRRGGGSPQALYWGRALSPNLQLQGRWLNLPSQCQKSRGALGRVVPGTLRCLDWECSSIWGMGVTRIYWQSGDKLVPIYFSPITGAISPLSSGWGLPCFPQAGGAGWRVFEDCWECGVALVLWMGEGRRLGMVKNNCASQDSPKRSLPYPPLPPPQLN